MTVSRSAASSLTRRHMLYGGIGTVAAASLIGCDALSTAPDSEQKDRSADDAARTGKQAPELAAMVEAGDLPALEERLPDEPVVVEPVDRPGVYGGVWNSGLVGVADAVYLRYIVGYDNLVRWRPSLEWSAELKDVIPNLAAEFEQNDDGTEYTFHLRAGLKWSDGKPFTADDLVFAQNDVLNHPDISPGTPRIPTTAEKVDELTVRFVLEQPDALFLQRQAEPGGDALVNYPMHYLQQFHEKYNDNVAELAEEEGAQDWVQLFQMKGTQTDVAPAAARWQNPDLPTLYAWVLKTPVAEGQRVSFERNPYYWKVDPDGRQLPYIERIVFDLAEDAEVMSLRAANGDLHFADRHVNTLQNKPILAKSREAGDYEFFDTIPSLMNDMIISFNLTSKDPVKREVFRNKDFRIALSYAINREELSSTSLQGQGEPWQVAPRSESPFYDEEMAKQYTEYDVDLSNELLDNAGFADRDGDGRRLGPDGKPIVFSIGVTEAFGLPWVDMLELVRDYWLDVGVDMRVQPMERSLFFAKLSGNDHDANVWTGEQGLEVLLQHNRYFASSAGNLHATLWGEWYETNGESGEEPPEATQAQMELYDELLRQTDPSKQVGLIKEVLGISKEEFYTIGTVMTPEGYGIVKNNFHNVPHKMVASPTYSNPGSLNTCQFFIEDV